MTYHNLVEKVQTALAKADASKVENHIAVQVNVTGEAAGAFYMEISEGVLYVAPYNYNDRDALLTGDGAEILNVAEGRITIKDAAESQKIVCECNSDEQWQKVLTLGSVIPKKRGRKPSAKVEAVKEKAEAKVEEVKEQAAAKLEEVKEQAAAKVEEVKEQAATKVEEVKEQAAAKVEEVKEQAAVVVEEVKEKAEAKVEEVKETAKAKRKKATSDKPAKTTVTKSATKASKSATPKKATSKKSGSKK